MVQNKFQELVTNVTCTQEIGSNSLQFSEFDEKLRKIKIFRNILSNLGQQHEHYLTLYIMSDKNLTKETNKCFF